MLTLLFCTVMPVLVAARALGWFAVFFAVGGFVVGAVFAYGVAWLGDRILRIDESWLAKPWAGIAIVTAYILLPMSAMFGAVGITVAATIWIIARLS